MLYIQSSDIAHQHDNYTLTPTRTKDNFAYTTLYSGCWTACNYQKRRHYEICKLVLVSTCDKLCNLCTGLYISKEQDNMDQLQYNIITKFCPFKLCIHSSQPWPLASHCQYKRQWEAIKQLQPVSWWFWHSTFWHSIFASVHGIQEILPRENGLLYCGHWWISILCCTASVDHKSTQLLWLVLVAAVSGEIKWPKFCCASISFFDLEFGAIK